MYFCALVPDSRSATTCVHRDVWCGTYLPPLAVIIFWTCRLDARGPVGPLIAITQPAAVSFERRCQLTEDICFLSVS